MQPRPVPLVATLSQHAAVLGELQDEDEVWAVGREDDPMAMARTLMMVLASILVVGCWLVGSERLRLEVLFGGVRCSCGCVSEVKSLLVGREADGMGQLEGEERPSYRFLAKLPWTEAKSIQRGKTSPSCVMTQISTSENKLCDVAASHN